MALSMKICKRVTVLERREGDMLALACRGVSAALSARYKSGLEARREQHELILLHPHPTVPSYAATNPLIILIRQPTCRVAAQLGDNR
jgi:hypothetical protein